MQGTIEEEAAAEDQGLLGRFIDYIQMRKMVPIEEAATEFGLRSSEVVDRIQGLESMGRLTGVTERCNTQAQWQHNSCITCNRAALCFHIQGSA